MTLGVFLAVLGAAFLHALWNALIKLGTSKVGGMVILSIVEVPIGLAVVLLTAGHRPGGGALGDRGGLHAFRLQVLPDLCL